VTVNVLSHNRNHDTRDMKVCKSLHTLVMILGFHHSATKILALLECCKVLVSSLYVDGFALWPKKSVTTLVLKFLHFANKDTVQQMVK